MPLPDLQAACEETLIRGLPPSLVASLESGLAAGLAPAVLLDMVRKITGGPRQGRGCLTYLAVEAWLKARTGYDGEKARLEL